MAYEIGLFSSGRDEAAVELLDSVYNAAKKGIIPDSEISFVFCDREYGEFEESDKFIDKVKEYDIYSLCLSHRKFKPELRKKGIGLQKENGNWNNQYLQEWKKLYFEDVDYKLANYPGMVDINVLMGFMLWVDESFCKEYNIINLHPALPDGPKGTWQEVIWELIEKKAKKTGTMMHLVTEELDRGLPITYCKVPIVGKGFANLWANLYKKLDEMSLDEIKEIEGEYEPLFKAIRNAQYPTETPLLIHTIGEFARGNIKIIDKELYAKQKGGHDMTGLVNQNL